ncbi:MAG: DUF4304 domain-containing protein [Clostridia bacterium]|nr:DUF4304 domain-containing protein [Clostridia bacterium]
MNKMLRFRKAILRADFKEATREFNKFHFYRYTTEKVAFILNLKDIGDYVQITYGYTSIADEEFLRSNGEDDDNIKVRFSVVVRSEIDEAIAFDMIKNVYDTYRNSSKDEILLLKKERQKQFLQKISEKLKPMGFKKKGAKWKIPLENDFCLEFEAQKSQWSDEYYFNVCVYRNDICFPCYYTRIVTNDDGKYDWQLMTDDELNNVLSEAIQGTLLPIISTPLFTLGTQRQIWQGCICQRNKCNICWVQKNLWEANEEK